MDVIEISSLPGHLQAAAHALLQQADDECRHAGRLNACLHAHAVIHALVL